MKTYEYVKAHIKVHGISQAELSEKSGVPYSTLSRFLAGKSDIRTEHLNNILDSLGINLNLIIRQKINEFLSEDVSSESDSLFTVFSSLPRTKKKIVFDTLAKSIPKSKQKQLKRELDSIKSLVYL